jgi:hypothetical protein
VTAVIRTSLRAQVSGASILRPPSDVLNTLIYFLLGLILISQARFALLRADWNGEHIPISRGLPARWAMYTLLLLSGIAAVASVLPTRDTLGLLNALGYLLSIVSIIFQLVVLAITSIVSFVIGLFMSLIGRPSTPPPSAPAQPLPVNPTPIAVSIPWGEVAKSLVFWIVFLGMLGYVLLRYLRQHPAILIKVRQMPAVIWLGQTWRRVRDRLRGARARLAAVLKSAPRPSRTQHVRQPTHAAPRWVNLRRLSPRQRVQFFYLAMVRRGGEAGVGRQPSHTPYEYAIILREGRPEVIDEVTGLTEEFVEARYSRREIALEEARLVQRYWDRIKRALRRQGR